MRVGAGMGDFSDPPAITALTSITSEKLVIEYIIMWYILNIIIFELGNVP
jgi:hypothetical protein